VLGHLKQFCVLSAADAQIGGGRVYLHRHSSARFAENRQNSGLNPRGVTLFDYFRRGLK
jgi:hypothetical protein